MRKLYLGWWIYWVVLASWNVRTAFQDAQHHHHSDLAISITLVVLFTICGCFQYEAEGRE